MSVVSEDLTPVYPQPSLCPHMGAKPSHLSVLTAITLAITLVPPVTDPALDHCSSPSPDLGPPLPIFLPSRTGEPQKT